MAHTDFSGTWKLDRNENWDGFASAVGMNFVARKMSGKSKPTMVLKQDEEKLEVEIQTMLFNRTEVVYLNGDPFENTAMDGTARTCVARWDGEVLAQTSEPKDPTNKSPKVTNTREITPDGEMLATITVHKPEGDVVCKRWFKKQ
ncbi:fatty acid-binding protein, brain-like [Lineus longissimus]|uniref:fatty acid-binding protein, brain-like n=1 Tax=Lineus longissimus TaxID=88925 RepID=UPI002B4EC2A8